MGAATYPEFPVAFVQRTENGGVANDTAGPSLPDSRMDSPPFLGRGPNFELGAVQVGVGEDDGRPDPFSNVDHDCALTGTGRLLGCGVGMETHRRRRHEVTLGALYPL